MNRFELEREKAQLAYDAALIRAYVGVITKIRRSDQRLSLTEKDDGSRYAILRRYLDEDTSRTVDPTKVVDAAKNRVSKIVSNERTKPLQKLDQLAALLASVITGSPKGRLTPQELDDMRGGLLYQLVYMSRPDHGLYVTLVDEQKPF